MQSHQTIVCIPGSLLLANLELRPGNMLEFNCKNIDLHDCNALRAV